MLAHALAFFLAQMSATPASAPMIPVPSPRPSGPVYIGNPAVKLTLESRPLGVDPDGSARWLLIARYLDAQGQPTKIMLNSDLDWMPDRGATQWQARMRFGQPAAIVRLHDLRPVRIRVHSNQPKMADAYASTAPEQWSGPRVVAAALGPHLIQIGWFPRERDDVRIVRDGGGGSTIISVGGPSQTYRDAGVVPGKTYRYEVFRKNQHAVRLPPITVPQPLPPVTVDAASGKGMWLSFGTNPYDDHFVGNWNAQAIVDQAVRAGLHFVELRTAYGAYWEVAPEHKAVIDAVIDGLAAHGIGVIGWTVPRQASFDDLAASIRTAAYRTPKGTRMSGLGIDLERGDEFMHDCPEGCIAMVEYIARIRQAAGPNYKIVATIEDPFLEHLDNSKYPFAKIARYADVLQPMTYWRMMSRRTMSVAQMEDDLQGSYRKVRDQSRRQLPISMGGQTTPENALGRPPADELAASILKSKAIGAIGECFFDWDGTSAEQWDALSRTPW